MCPIRSEWVKLWRSLSHNLTLRLALHDGSSSSSLPLLETRQNMVAHNGGLYGAICEAEPCSSQNSVFLAVMGTNLNHKSTFQSDSNHVYDSDSKYQNFIIRDRKCG